MTQIERIKIYEDLLRESHSCIGVAVEAIEEMTKHSWKGKEVVGLLNRIALNLAKQ